MLKRLIYSFLATAGLVFLNLGIVSAASTSGPTVTESYNASSSVLPGMLVQLNTSTKALDPLNQKSVNKMLGVVVPVNDAPIVLTNTNASGQQVLVAPSGKYNVLVSNENGPIKPGDRLSMSSTAGIAMKAQPTQLQIIGQADTGFTGSSNILGNETLTSNKGAVVKATIGSVLANVTLSINPNYSNNTSILPSFAIKEASVVAGKPVSTFRIILAIITIATTIIITVSLLYGGVRSRIISIGRNPLARSAIAKGLMTVAISGLIVFVAGLIVSYLFLKL